MEPLLVFGAGGHAKVILDIIEKCGEKCGDRQGRYKVVGVVDKLASAGAEFFGYSIFEESDQLGKLATTALIAIGNNALREKVAARAASLIPGLKFATVVHPSAQIGKAVVLGPGTVVMAGACINASTQIGSHCIVNTRVSVDHDCEIGEFSSIAPGATLGGSVRVGRGAAVSLGASVIQGIAIGRDAIVGAGAVVVSNVPDSVISYGNPAKVIRTRKVGDGYL